MSTLKYSVSLHGLPHELPVEEVIAGLGADPQIGLTSKEARERLAFFGSNVLSVRTRVPAWLRFLAQFRDPQIYLLFAAAAISIVVSLLERASGISYEALIILAIVFLNAVLGFIQEDRAERALASLQNMAPAEATVIRDAVQQRLLARDLVPGDLLVIREGDLIPADARLVQTRSLHTTEASLTGESLPILKNTVPLDDVAAIGDRLNMVFAGTMAISGNGRAIVTATGMQTEFGRIAELLDTSQEQVTPLQLQLKRLSKQLSVAVVAIAVAIITTLLILRPLHSAAELLSLLLFGTAVAVAATPEGLAAVITLVLAIGVQRMARRGAIIRKLPAVETLGCTTVIASDKTGTMTRNEMTVSAIVTASGRTDISGIGYSPEGNLTNDQHEKLSEEQWAEVQQVLLGAVLVNNAQLNHSGNSWTIQGAPTEAALLTVARKAGIISSVVQSQYPRLAEAAFSSERKMMSTVHASYPSSNGLVVFTKGAPDVLLNYCTHEFASGVSRPLTPHRRQEILYLNEQLTEGALRTLGVATRLLDSGEVLDPDNIDGRALEARLTFLGLVGMMYPPRPEAALAVERARVAGIRTILITGDHPHTAVAVARALHIIFNDRVLFGAQLDQISDEDLLQSVRETGVYARVSPEHKLRIVRALQQNNEIVAMTGDGANDAPALKAAHIGIAMGITGTDVSKQAADLVLTDDNFATIVAAVEEGRIVFDNIRKFLAYLLATNIGEVLTIFLSAVLLSMRTSNFSHALVLPFSAAQILWINLVTDSAPALALGVDTSAQDIMKRPPRLASESIVNYRMAVNIGVVAIVMTIGTLSISLMIPDSASVLYRRSMTFTTLILFQLFSALCARSETDSAFFDMFGNQWLWGAIALSVGLQIVLLNVPFLRNVFGVASLSPADWFISVSIASSVLWVSEIKKYIARHTKRTS